MFSLYEPLGLGVPVCGCFWHRPRRWHLLWAASMSTKSEVALAKPWAMSFRSLDYLVVFYYQVFVTKKAPFTPFGCC